MKDVKTKVRDCPRKIYRCSIGGRWGPNVPGFSISEVYFFFIERNLTVFYKFISESNHSGPGTRVEARTTTGVGFLIISPSLLRGFFPYVLEHKDLVKFHTKHLTKMTRHYSCLYESLWVSLSNTDIVGPHTSHLSRTPCPLFRQPTTVWVHLSTLVTSKCFHSQALPNL